MKKIHLSEIESQIVNLTLSDNKRSLFRQRYLSILKEYQGRANRYSMSFHLLRLIVGIGSLFVPALLSIQQIGVDGTSNTNITLSSLLYWATWVLSLMVTMSNGVFTLFKIDKKYYFMHTLMEQLCSEGWQFMTLTGRYGIYRRTDASGNYIHDPAFGLFCHMVEKIKMHQVEEEYFKLTDDYTKQDKQSGAATISKNTIAGSGSGPAPSPPRSSTPVHDRDEAVMVNMNNNENNKLPGSTDISIMPKTPQNQLNLESLPPDIMQMVEQLYEARMANNIEKTDADNKNAERKVSVREVL
jgi:hypothetical protein